MPSKRPSSKDLQRHEGKSRVFTGTPGPPSYHVWCSQCGKLLALCEFVGEYKGVVIRCSRCKEVRRI